MILTFNNLIIGTVIKEPILLTHLLVQILQHVFLLTPHTFSYLGKLYWRLLFLKNLLETYVEHSIGQKAT